MAIPRKQRSVGSQDGIQGPGRMAILRRAKLKASGEAGVRLARLELISSPDSYVHTAQSGKAEAVRFESSLIRQAPPLTTVASFLRESLGLR